MNRTMVKDILKLMLSMTLISLSLGKATAAYNPNDFNLQNTDPGLTQLHDESNLETRTYENYVRQDFQRRYVEPMPVINDERPSGSNYASQPGAYYSDNDTDYGYGSSDAMNAGVAQTQSAGTIYVGNVSVDPSEILTPEEVNKAVSNIIGRNVSISEIQEAVNNINKLYAARGFVTAKAYLPEQTISNGSVHIGLIESKVGNLTVNGNRWTKSRYITNRVGQDADSVFDIVKLEKDIVSFNRYNEGVNLKANLKAGSAPGTTDIEINAEEKFPFHVVGVMDNAGRYSTGHLRGGAMIYADSLFKNRDKLSIGSYFSGGATSPFVDYNFPVNRKDGRVGFLFSSTFAKVKYGPQSWMDMHSYGYQYSLYYTQPLVRRPDLELKSYAAINYKRSRLESGILSPVMEPLGLSLPTNQVTSAEIALNLRKDTRYGIWYLNQNAYYAFPILDPDSNYFKYSGSVTRLHDFSHGVVAQLRGNYQIVPQNKDIPWLDQMQSGGLFTVRGYNEGIMIGKNGYFVSGELIFPILPSTIAKNREGGGIPFLGRYVKGAVFADHAGIFPKTGSSSDNDSYFLASLGLGLRIQLPGSLTGRVYWGFPLINNRNETARTAGRFHFEVTLAPDIDALLNKRSTKQVVVEEKHVEAVPAPAPAPAPAPEPINNYPDVRHYDYFFDVPGAAL